MELLSVKFGKAKVETTDTSAGDVFICSPERSLAKNLGIVFGVVELNGVSEYFNEAFLEILNDLRTEYYLPPFHLEAGPEKRFEECIQRANRRINKAINESVEELDISNINALIGLSHKNSVYMAYAGGVRANLLHLRKDGQLVAMDVLGNSDDKKIKITQEKIFHDIASGQISGRDTIFILSENTSRFISNADLVSVAENNPLSLAGELEGLLRSQSPDNNFYLLTIEPDYERVDGQEIVGKQQGHRIQNVVEATPPEHSINTLISTQKETERYLTPSSIPSWQKILILIFTGLKKAAAYLYPKIKKLAIYLGKQLGRLISSLFKKIFKKKNGGGDGGATSHNEDLSHTDGRNLGSAIDNNDVAIDNDIADNNQPTINYSSEIDTSFNTSDSKLMGSGILGAISVQINKVLAKIASLKKMQKIILLVVFILFFTFSESIVLMGRGGEPNPPKATQVAANQIEDKINLAEAQNIFSDEAGAKNLIKEAQDLLDKIPKKKSNLALISGLQAKIDSLRMTIQKISSIENPQMLFDLNSVSTSTQAEAISLVGQNIIVSGGQNSSISQIDLIKKQVTSNTLSEQGLNISKITPIDTTNLLFLDNNKGVFKYSIKSTSSQNLIPSAQTADMTYYLGSIYLLDKTKGQILKYQIKNGKATGAATAIKDVANLSQASALAVNGDFFVFKDNGEIKHYAKAQDTGIKYESLDPALKTPTQLFAGSKDYLYVLDRAGKKVAIYDEKGSLKVQITSPKFGVLQSMAVNEKEKKIYLLSDNKIFVINTGL